MVNSAQLCPICEKPTVAAYKPFCSKKCADIDLNQWLVGNYRIEGSDSASSDAEDSYGDDKTLG